MVSTAVAILHVLDRWSSGDRCLAKNTRGPPKDALAFVRCTIGCMPESAAAGGLWIETLMLYLAYQAHSDMIEPAKSMARSSLAMLGALGQPCQRPGRSAIFLPPTS